MTKAIEAVDARFEKTAEIFQCKVQPVAQVPQIEPLAAISAPAPIAIAALVQPVTSEPMAPRSDGRVPVRKTILHRGRSFAVTYWVKAASIAA